MGAAALWAGIGAAAAWLAFSWLDDERTSPDSLGSARSAPAERVAPDIGAERSGAPRDAAPGVELDQPPGVDAGNAEPAAPGDPADARSPIVANAPPSNSPATQTGLPNRSAEDPSAVMPAAELLDLPRITCDFGAGNNTGHRYGELLTVGGGAQWRGGLLTYDLTVAGAGTARLTGTPSVTGSPTGETEVQVTTEGSRVFLSGFQQDRAFVVVTIFDELDDVGRRIAVMSRHEGTFSYASQFLGTCE